MTFTHYTGAYGFHLYQSSVPVDIHEFFQRDRMELERIVPLPYVSKTEIGTADTIVFEDMCLQAIKERALGFSMRGSPVGYIVVELFFVGLLKHTRS